MPRVIVSGHPLSGTIEPSPDGDLLRCQQADWEAAGLRVGQVVEHGAQMRVVRSVMLCHEADVWVWLTHASAAVADRHACGHR